MGKVIGYRACHAITCEVMVVINKNFTMAKYLLTLHHAGIYIRNDELHVNEWLLLQEMGQKEEM